MKLARAGVPLVLLLPLVSLAPLHGQTAPASPHAPVPAVLLHARSIFISNDGADGGLFPQPFTGDTARGYDELFAGLHAQGDYELVSDPAQADLVLEIRLHAPNGPANPNKQLGAADPLPTFRLVVYDARSHYVVWALTESVGIALKQSTHDRNFDEAVSRLVADFVAITHPAPEGKP